MINNSQNGESFNPYSSQQAFITILATENIVLKEKSMNKTLHRL